jgi:hypothetical protein
MTPIFVAVLQMFQDTSAAFIGALLAIAYYERFARPRRPSTAPSSDERQNAVQHAAKRGRIHAERLHLAL